MTKKLLLLLVPIVCNYSLNAYLQLTSPAFKHNGQIPEKYTCDGDNVSPELNWTGAPVGTKSFVLIVEDPDAPGKIWTHWLLFNIPANVNHLAENASTEKFISGATDFNGQHAYGGPCPPSGTHRYNFTLYALDIMPNESERDLPDALVAGSDKKHVLQVMHGHVLDQATLTGRYSRKIKK